MSKGSIIATIIAVVAIVAAGLLFLKLKSSEGEKLQKEQEIAQLEEAMDYQKKELEQEYMDLQLEIEGYNAQISNDSIVELFNQEKQRVQLLLDELRTVKSTNAKRISQLKGELSTVRQVLITYVHQVDSLNKINKVLFTENLEVKKSNKKLSTKADSLTRKTEALTEVVGRAAQLEASNFKIRTLTKKGKDTKSLRKITQIEVCFSIAKNVTAEPGKKAIYARILKPDNDALSKNAANTFTYEDKDISYSMKKTIEYKNEWVHECMYWNVSETLLEGKYRVDLFIEGRLVGSANFTLED